MDITIYEDMYISQHTPYSCIHILAIIYIYIYILFIIMRIQSTSYIYIYIDINKYTSW